MGTGKSSLIAAMCRELAGELELGVVTNDIYTTEDARFLREQGVLPAGRIEAVQTGCCPHTAIRDDISMNLQAVEELERPPGPLAVVFVESGGDNLRGKRERQPSGPRALHWTRTRSDGRRSARSSFGSAEQASDHGTPALSHVVIGSELRAEIATADSVDLIWAFVI